MILLKGESNSYNWLIFVATADNSWGQCCTPFLKSKLCCCNLRTLKTNGVYPTLFFDVTNIVLNVKLQCVFFVTNMQGCMHPATRGVCSRNLTA